MYNIFCIGILVYIGVLVKNGLSIMMIQWKVWVCYEEGYIKVSRSFMNCVVCVCVYVYKSRAVGYFFPKRFSYVPSGHTIAARVVWCSLYSIYVLSIFTSNKRTSQISDLIFRAATLSVRILEDSQSQCY